MEKAKRVKTKEDFQKVIASKQKISSHSFVIFYLESVEYNYARYGISAPKKLGNAVMRVQVRRRVRAMIQEIEKKFTVEAKDYVILVRKSFLEGSYQKNKDELENLFLKFKGESI